MWEEDEKRKGKGRRIGAGRKEMEEGKKKKRRRKEKRRKTEEEDGKEENHEQEKKKFPFHGCRIIFRDSFTKLIQVPSPYGHEKCT